MPTIVCGFRDDDGIVEKVVQVGAMIIKNFLVNMYFLNNCCYSLLQYSVNDLPRSCSEHWQPNVCMGFLDAVLAHIKTEMSQGKNRISYL